MPRKPSAVVVMRDYPPLPSRRWIKLRVVDVGRPGREKLRLVLSIGDEPSQAGRTIVHEVPAVLARGSPLSQLLADGFGIRLTENQPFDLTSLIGQTVEARFSKSADGVAQAIVAVRTFAPLIAPQAGESKAALTKPE